MVNYSLRCIQSTNLEKKSTKLVKLSQLHFANHSSPKLVYCTYFSLFSSILKLNFTYPINFLVIKAIFLPGHDLVIENYSLSAANSNYYGICSKL